MEGVLGIGREPSGGGGFNPRPASPAPPERNGRKGLLKEKLQLEKVRTADGRTRWTVASIDEQLSFDKGFYVFIRALQLLKANNDGVVLVGLAGASGSGKTAFSERVRSFMPGVAVISMDNYNDASKLIDGNFDDPRLPDYDLLLANLSDLRAGRPAEVPIYDFKTSSRVGFNTVPVPPSRVVVVEGIYALSERLRPLLDLRVSITGGVHFDLVKRVMRDITRSGQGPEEIISQITDTVYPMYKAFIEPDLVTAQLRIYNSFNPFAGLMDASHILKCKRTPAMTEEAVLAALGPDSPPPRREAMYDIHLLPPNEDPETCSSWLRMRNRDGRYTLMFEEWVTEGPFIISPRITFEVSVRVLGGLMALGYEIGTIMRRRSTLFSAADGSVTVKLDEIDNLGEFVQVFSRDRDRAAEMARTLGMTEFIPRSYIEQVQLGQLTQEFQDFGDDVRKRFSVGSDALSFDEVGAVLGTSPRGGLGLIRGGVRGQAAHRAAMVNVPTGGVELSSSAPVSSTFGRSHGAKAVTVPGGSSGGGSGSGGGSSGRRNEEPGSPTAGDDDEADRASLGSVGRESSGLLGHMDLSPEPPAGAAADVGGKASSALLDKASIRRGDGAAAGGKGTATSGLLGEQLAMNASGGGGGGGKVGHHPLRRRGSNHELAAAASVEAGGRLSACGNRPSGQHVGNGSNGDAAAAAAAAYGRVASQLEVLGEGVRRYSGISLQLDAMIHHQKALTAGVEALSEVAEGLKAALVAQQQQQQQSTVVSGGSPSSSAVASLATAVGGENAAAAVLMGAGAVCVAVGVSLGMLLGGRSQR